MKKNYFGKLLAIAMVFAGFSLTSCDENDNAIINGEVWVKPEIQLVDGGAVVKASTISDINRMIGRLMEDVAESANAGETFTISIESPALDATESEHTVIIPTLKDADIVLNFTSPISTDAPLQIQSMGVKDDDNPGASTSDLEINFAPGTSNIDLNLNMPSTTVTLNNVTINELIASTAVSTLIIKDGVTVEWLMMKGNCRTLVMKGAKVNGFLRDDYAEISDEGVSPRALAKMVEEVLTPDGYDVAYYKEDVEPAELDPYYVQKLKIIKNEEEDYTYIGAWSNNEEKRTDVDIIVADGAKAWIMDYWHGCIASVTGEGDAEVKGDLNIVKQLKDITSTAYNLPQNAENCTFKGNATNPYPFSISYSDKIEKATFKDCKFELVVPEDSKDDLPETYYILASFPALTAEGKEPITSCTYAFDNCEFNENYKFSIHGINWEEIEDLTYGITFDETKMGGKAITNKTELIEYISSFDKENPQPFFNIDGTIYVPSWDDEEEVYILVKPEAKKE